MTQLADLSEQLRQGGFKPTRQRQVILKALLANQDEHLSADELFHLVHAGNPEIGFATIYRTLNLLCDLEILRKLHFADGLTRYELKTQNKGHHHHHLICLGCGQVWECERDSLDQLEKRISRDRHFQITDHSLKFYGYCAQCRKDKKT